MSICQIFIGHLQRVFVCGWNWGNSLL